MGIGEVLTAIRRDIIDEFKIMLETTNYPYGEIADFALDYNKPHLVDFMLKDQKYYSVNLLLQYALKHEKLRIVKYCADNNLSGYSYEGDPLYIAVRLGYYDLAQEIIDKNPKCTRYYSTAVAILLVYAMRKMDFEVLKFLAKNSILTYDNVSLAEELNGDNSWP